MANYNERAWRVDDVCDTATWRWTRYAACAGTDPDAWFGETDVTLKVLAQICARCHVRTECLAWAVEHDELGYWAGTTPHQRKRLRAQANAERRS